MTYIPAWVLCIPDPDDPGYLDYLLNEAIKNGMPEHVRKRLVIRFILNENFPRANGLAIQDNSIVIEYLDAYTREMVYDNIERIWSNDD